MKLTCVQYKFAIFQISASDISFDEISDCSMLLCTWAYILYNHSKYPISETIFDFMREQVRQQMESATVCPGCLVERPCSNNEDLPDCKHVF